MDDVELQPDLPGRQRNLVEQLGHRREVRRLRDDELLDLLDADRPEIKLPIEAGGQLGQLGKAHLVVGLVDVAVFHLGPLGLGNPGFQGHDLGGGLLGIADLGQRQHPLDIGLIGLQLRFELGIPVVIAVGQAQARLAISKDVLVRLLRVGARRSNPAGRTTPIFDSSANVRMRSALVWMASTAASCAAIGSDAQFFRSGFIHERGVQVAHLLAFRAGGIVLGRGAALDDLAESFSAFSASMANAP